MTRATTEAARRAKGKYRREHLAKGLCVTCPNEALPGRTRCATCYEKERVAKNEKRSQRRERSQCRTCGTPVEHGTYCPQHREEENARARLRTSKRMERGLCKNCGRKAIGEGHARCADCFFGETAANNLRDVTMSSVIREIFERQGGICPYTGTRLIAGVNASLDHVLPVSRFPERFRDPDNLEWIRKGVNQMKHNRTREEFLEMVHMIADHTRELKP